MVDSPNTSFIPKHTLGSVPGRVSHRRTYLNVPSFVGMVIFLCGMILAVGVFLYKDFSQNTLATKKQALQDIKNSFSQGDIEALRDLDRRITVAQALLDVHLSPSVMFDALELRTQHDLRFTDFSYVHRESGSVAIVLKGTALRFNTVALQSKQFADADVLARTIFSNITVDDKGNVQFTVTSEGNNATLAYTATPMSATLPTQGQDVATTTDELTIPVDAPIPYVKTTSPNTP